MSHNRRLLKVFITTFVVGVSYLSLEINTLKYNKNEFLLANNFSHRINKFLIEFYCLEFYIGIKEFPVGNKI